MKRASAIRQAPTARKISVRRPTDGGAEVPPALTLLKHEDPKGRFRLVYPRDWHVTG